VVRIRCFLLEPTPVAARWLRRYESGDCPEMPGVKPGYRYHNTLARIADDEVRRDPDGTLSISPSSWPEEDDRWPTRCRCGHVFTGSAEQQLFWVQMYRGPDGKLYSIHASELPAVERAPAGAMWFADWMPYSKGPDGRCLVVRCPADPDGSGVSDWMPDGPSLTNPAPAWQRTGEPPRVTVTPSIFVSPPAGFHGFLTAGELVGV
jgi:hypothetical protein